MLKLYIVDRWCIYGQYRKQNTKCSRNPSTDVVIRIAEILQVSSDHLLFGELPKNELVLFNEWKKLMQGRSTKEIESAQNIVKCFFENLDERCDVDD